MYPYSKLQTKVGKTTNVVGIDAVQLIFCAAPYERLI